MSWETVIGLEIHVQLATQSKIFSGASTTYGAEPNAQACAVDLGLPGVLPVLNEAAVEMAIKFGLAIGAEINLHSIFDRKNYFYPDLPKGYQISQFATPIVGKGEITLDLQNGNQRIIGITRAHLEEDAGKSVHDLFSGQTGIDLNRTGTPLLEVVSDPDLRSASEAAEYFRQMHGLVKYLGICDGNLAEGSMRCDANVSVRPSGQDEFGERTEIKNINSFRFVERAIELEIERQIDVLEAGGTIHRETRLFDADADETRTMRSKELSEDYRYFPDPDLLPLQISEAFVQTVRDNLPELPDARRERYQQTLGLSAYDAASLSSDLERAEFFEALVGVCGNPKLSANWLNGELSAHLNSADLEIAACPVSAKQLGQLIQRIDDETLSSKTAKELFKALWARGDAASTVDELIEHLGLKQMNDDGELTAVVNSVLEANPDQVAELRSGKDKVLGFLVGQVMKATGGKANPKQVNEMIRNNL
jgi:aspartyl-tRNA(Asn)/glutamyl-tRNA(Gln) amidotransferase subunit B